jgi:hypothetical protein
VRPNSLDPALRPRRAWPSRIFIDRVDLIKVMGHVHADRMKGMIGAFTLVAMYSCGSLTHIEVP